MFESTLLSWVLLVTPVSVTVPKPAIVIYVESKEICESDGKFYQTNQANLSHSQVSYVCMPIRADVPPKK